MIFPQTLHRLKSLPAIKSTKVSNGPLWQQDSAGVHREFGLLAVTEAILIPLIDPTQRNTSQREMIFLLWKCSTTQFLSKDKCIIPTKDTVRTLQQWSGHSMTSTSFQQEDFKKVSSSGTTPIYKTSTMTTLKSPTMFLINSPMKLAKTNPPKEENRKMNNKMNRRAVISRKTMTKEIKCFLSNLS